MSTFILAGFLILFGVMHIISTSIPLWVLGVVAIVAGLALLFEGRWKRGVPLVAALAGFLTLPAAAQTTNETAVVTSIYSIAKEFAQAMPSNYVVTAYGEYAKDAPTKYGGGVLAFWNVTQNVGVGGGVDWLGQWSQLSANLQLQAPVKPLAFMGGSLTNWTVTPFAIGGVVTPIGSATSGANSVGAMVGGGAACDIGKIFGGTLGVEVGYVNVTGMGLYSGNRIEAGLAWRRGF